MNTSEIRPARMADASALAKLMEHLGYPTMAGEKDALELYRANHQSRTDALVLTLRDVVHEIRCRELQI